MGLQLAIYDQPGGSLVADYSSLAASCQIVTNVHGFAELRAFVPLGLDASFSLSDRAALPHVMCTDDGANTVFEGRLEDVEITDGGVQLAALGYSRSLSDAPYTALWSLSSVAPWRPMTTAESAGRSPEHYQFDTNNRVQISLPQGQIYGNVANVGTMIYQKPDGGSRQIIGVMFDAVVNLPNGWNFAYVGWDTSFGVVSSATIFASGGATTTINKFYTFAASDFFSFDIYNNTGANYLVNNAPNTWQVIITNIRLVTATTNKVDTTMTANQVAGANITSTVGSTARMYVGQRLHIGLAAANGEGVIVKQILSATQFVADFTAPFAIGTNVQAFVVYADEIVNDLIGVTSALNFFQLSSSTGQVVSPARDLYDADYTDAYPSDILNNLITLGDSATIPQQYEWGVATGRKLFFRPRSTIARTWYVDASSLDIQHTINALYNSIYATYQEASGRTLRTASSTDATSTTRYGVTRRKPIEARTTSSTFAQAQRDAALADTADPIPRAGLTFARVHDASGAIWPLYAVRAGDLMTIRNLPPTLGTVVDRIRTFRITRTTYDAVRRTLTVEPESPLPTLQALLSVAVPPQWVGRAWWMQGG